MFFRCCVTGSIPSLGAGLLFGSVLGFGAYQLSADPSNYYVSLGTSAALGGIMGMRFLNSGKFMPPGLIAVMRWVGTICVCARKSLSETQQ